MVHYMEISTFYSLFLSDGTKDKDTRDPSLLENG